MIYIACIPIVIVLLCIFAMADTISRQLAHIARILERREEP